MLITKINSMKINNRCYKKIVVIRKSWKIRDIYFFKVR